MVRVGGLPGRAVPPIAAATMMKVAFHFGGGEQLITLPTENKKKAKITGMRTFRGANPRSTIDHQVAVNALRESKRHRYDMEERVENDEERIVVKGKGTMRTWWIKEASRRAP